MLVINIILTKAGEIKMSTLFKSVEISDITGKSYMTEVEVNTTASHHNQSIIEEPINSELPYYIKTGIANYWTGSVSANFADNKSNPCEGSEYGEYDLTNDEFRFEFVEWMHNGLPKTLKLSNNFIMKVDIGNEITVDSDSTVDDETAKISFEWTQIGKRYRETNT